MSNTCSVLTIISFPLDTRFSPTPQERAEVRFQMEDLFLKLQNTHDLLSLLAEVYPDVPSFHVDSRSVFCGEPKLYKNISRIEIEEETAWNDKTEAWSLIMKHYPLLKRYYLAYEPGFELFQTNDELGMFFPVEYRIDASVPNWKDVFPNGKPVDGECVFEDFTDDTKLLEWLRLHTGLDCRTVEKAREEIRNCLPDDGFFNIFPVERFFDGW